MDKKRREELRKYCDPHKSPQWVNREELSECLDEIDRLEKDVRLLEKVVRLMSSITIDQKNTLDEMLNQVQELQMSRLS